MFSNNVFLAKLQLKELIGVLTTGELNWSDRYDLALAMNNEVTTSLTCLGLSVDFWPYDDGYEEECLWCLEIARNTLRKLDAVTDNISKVNGEAA
jgi:hypothetical protein